MPGGIPALPFGVLTIPGMLAWAPAALWLALAPSPSESVELSWTAPVECPSHQQVLESTWSRVPEAQDSGSTSVLRATAVVRKQGTQYVMELQLHDGPQTGVRTLEDPECEAISEAAALILALAVIAQRPPPPSEPGADDPDPPGVPDVVESQTSAPPRPEPESDSKPDPKPGIPSRPRLWFGARAGGGVGLGALPRPGFELEVTPWLELARLRVELPIRWQPSRPARYEAAPDRGADIGRWAVGTKVCGVGRVGRFAFPGCGGVELGQMYGSGVGLPRNRSARILWASVLASGGAELSLGARWGLLALLQGGIALTRPRFRGQNSGVVHQASIWNATGLLGVFFRASARNSPRVSKEQLR